MFYNYLLKFSERYADIPGGNIGFQSYNRTFVLDTFEKAFVLTSTRFTFQGNVSKLFFSSYGTGSFYADVS